MADHKVRIKENEKRVKYLDIARDLKKSFLNMKVKLIPIVIGAIENRSQRLGKV